MDKDNFRKCVQNVIESKIQHYECNPESFIELWPLLGSKKYFGLLSQAKKDKDYTFVSLAVFLAILSLIKIETNV